MDPHLEKLLSSMLDANPEEQLDDKKRESIMYALLGMLPPTSYRAIWEFAGSISDEFKRSYLLHKFVRQVVAAFKFKFAEDVARSIPLIYWRLSALNAIASNLLKRDRAAKTTPNSWFRQKAFELIHEVEQNIPAVSNEDGDRASIVWEAGMALVEAHEFEWAERIAEYPMYCPDNTDVLLHVAKARMAAGERNEASRILRRIADVVHTTGGHLTNRAFDLLEIGELTAELGGEGRKSAISRSGTSASA